MRCIDWSKILIWWIQPLNPYHWIYYRTSEIMDSESITIYEVLIIFHIKWVRYTSHIRSKKKKAKKAKNSLLSLSYTIRDERAFLSKRCSTIGRRLLDVLSLPYQKHWWDVRDVAVKLWLINIFYYRLFQLLFCLTTRNIFILNWRTLFIALEKILLVLYGHSDYPTWQAYYKN